MDWKLEVVVIPVRDVDAAKEFYLGKLGFRLDADTQPSPSLRVVHMTPPGSACSVVIGPVLITGAEEQRAAPSLQLVVTDLDAARAELARAVASHVVRRVPRPGRGPAHGTAARIPHSG